MKRCIKCGLFMAALAVLFSLSAAALPPQTGNATTYTYTLNAENGWTRTQDAYLTGEVLFLNAPLTRPDDLTIRGRMLYVADTGAGRILRYDLDTGETASLGEGILQTPTGVFVTGEGNIYVADPDRAVVTMLSPEGELLREYGRPETTTFGEDSIYKPRKVTVDGNGILSIVSDGAYDGIVQLSPDGEFLGYFGYNSVPMTFLELLQDAFFTEAQKAQLFNNLPLSFYNLAIDSQGVIYTVTQGSEASAVKEHNVTGVNLLSESIPGEKNFADIAIGPDGQILAVTQTGLVYEYDSDGSLLFSFGGRAATSERSGLVTVASGIAVDEDAQLYVLDGERGLVHTYLSTDFADRLHGAVRQYHDGDYALCMENLETLLGQVGNVKVVYDYLGKNAFQLGQYEAAASYFRNAGNQSGYSDAFWEIRSRSMSWVIPAAFLLLIALSVAGAVVSRLRRRVPVPAERPPQQSRSRLLSDLAFSFRFFRHPFNSYYEVQTGKRGNVLSALILYLLAFLVFSLDYLFRGFSFSTRGLENTSPAYVVMMFFLPVGLFIISSYMVSEISDGKGRFRTMFIGLSYALVPLICLLPVVTLLTHVLTLNEAFLIALGSGVAYAWTGVLLVIALRELHDYEFHQVFVNIVLALFLMIIIIFVCSIIAMFWDRVVEMVTSIVKEVKYRVGL